MNPSDDHTSRRSHPETTFQLCVVFVHSHCRAHYGEVYLQQILTTTCTSRYAEVSACRVCRERRCPMPTHGRTSPSTYLPVDISGTGSANTRGRRLGMAYLAVQAPHRRFVGRSNSTQLRSPFGDHLLDAMALRRTGGEHPATRK